MNVREVLEYAKKNKVQSGGSEVCGSHRDVAALHDSDRGVDGRPVQGRFRPRRIVDPRLEGDQQQRHAGGAGSVDGLHRSLLCGPDPEPDRQRGRSDHPRDLRSRSPLSSPRRRRNICRAPRSATPPTGGPKPSSSFSIRPATIRRATAATTSSIPKKASGTWARMAINLGGKIRPEGRLLPGRPDRYAAGYPQRDDSGDGESRNLRSRSIITKSPRPVRRKSISASIRWSRRQTR